MFVSQFVCCIISDHTDGTAVQRATNNVDACTQCAYLFLLIASVRNEFYPVVTSWIFLNIQDGGLLVSTSQI